jgi:hypothetical protein
MGSWDDWGDDDDDVRRIRRRVRQKLGFYKNVVVFSSIVGGLALIDWFAGSDGFDWVHIPAIIFGAILTIEFMSTFIAPLIWGREAEDRLVRREVERRRGRIHIERAPAEPQTGRDAEPEQL